MSTKWRKMSSVIIGSARSDERGKYSGGAAGDQRQTSKPDYKGEVSMQSFYVHKKGWTILRAKNKVHAERLAEKMRIACNNPNVGYDQGNRLDIILHGVSSTVKTECDCSSLVRQCVKEATGKDPGNFTTDSERVMLMRTSFFEMITYKTGVTLYEGDILVTQTKGHTAIVVTGASRTSGKSITEIAREVIAGKWGNGEERKQRLKMCGYDPKEVQEIVNMLL